MGARIVIDTLGGDNGPKACVAGAVEGLKENPDVKLYLTGRKKQINKLLSEYEYARLIRTNDRATNLNLMVGLNGYTLCSGIICEELNGSDYIAVPYEEDDDHPNSIMHIGYITTANSVLSPMGERYIEALKMYLSAD